METMVIEIVARKPGHRSEGEASSIKTIDYLFVANASYRCGGAQLIQYLLLF